MVITQAAIDRLPHGTVAGLNACAFTAEQKFWRFGVNLGCFLGDLSV